MVLDLSGGPKGRLLVKKETISRGEDRISLLPESLLCHILSFLPTEEAVCTSVLSSSWKDLWKWVPRLELDNDSFQSNKACVDFINKFLLNFQSLSEFKLFITYNDRDDLDKVIKRRIQHFQVVYYHQEIELPLVTLPVCEALVSLKLYSVRLNDCESLSLPCLKDLLLFAVILPSDAVLDTPRLEHLESRNLVDNQLQSFKIISMSDSVKVKIDVDSVLTNYDLSERNILYNLLHNFSAVRDMTLSQHTLELIDSLSHMSPLPKFCDLTRLHATMWLDRCLELLPFVLERCQNLKHLTLKLVEYLEVVEATSLSNLVSSSLEYVEIESPITEKAAQLVRYFLGNVTSLKKLVLRLNVFRGEKHDPVLLKQRFDSPRRSNLCQFELLLLYKPSTFGSCLE